MIIKAAVRYPDGKKSLLQIDNVDYREEAVEFLKSELIEKTPLLTLVVSEKPAIMEKVLA